MMITHEKRKNTDVKCGPKRLRGKKKEGSMVSGNLKRKRLEYGKATKGQLRNKTPGKKASTKSGDHWSAWPAGGGRGGKAGLKNGDSLYVKRRKGSAPPGQPPDYGRQNL